MRSEKYLRNIFIVLMLFLFALIVSTPILVGHGVAIFDEKTKEIIEASMLFFLISVGFAIYLINKARLKKKEKQLDETMNYIGAVNLQVEQINSIVDTLTKYPECKKDFKYLFESLAHRALSGVNSEWVLFRIIDTDSGKTLTEYTRARGTAVLMKNEVSNKELLENKEPPECRVISSAQENLRIKVYCVLPVKSLNDYQTVLLKAIVNNLSMLYLIFASDAVSRHK